MWHNFSAEHLFSFATVWSGHYKTCWEAVQKASITSIAENSDNFQSITEFFKSENVLDAVLGIVDAWDILNNTVL